MRQLKEAIVALIVAISGPVFMTGPVAWAQGQPVWVQHARAHDTSFHVYPEELVHADTVFYLVGQAQTDVGVTFGTYLFDPKPLEQSHSFLAKYNPQGEVVWVRPGAFFAGKHQAISAFDVDLDSEGNILVGEGYRFLWDSGMITNGIVHVVKYSPEGDVLFDISIGEPKAEPEDWPAFAKGLEVNADGSFYVAGEVEGELVFGQDTIRTDPFYQDGSPSLDIFLAKYLSDGTPAWIELVHSDRTDYMVGLDPKGCFATDRHDNAYICGQMPEGTVFGEGQQNEFRMPTDAFAVAKYDPAGILQWVKWEGDGGLGVYLEEFRAGGIRRIAVDPSGRLLTVWYLNDRGPDTRAEVGDVVVRDSFYGAEFLVAHEPDGSAQLLAQFKSDGNEFVREIMTDSDGHIYVSGGFDGSQLSIGETALKKPDFTNNRGDGFVAKLDRDGNVLWTSQFAGAGRDWVQTATVSGAGDVYAAAFFQTELYIEGEFVADAVGRRDLLLAKYAASTVTSVEPSPETDDSQSMELAVYPNPASVSAHVNFNLATPRHVRIELFDALGRQVSVVTSRRYSTGQHQLTIPTSSLASGLYLLRGRLGEHTTSAKLLVTSP